jgi:hypothetical protein
MAGVELLDDIYDLNELFPGIIRQGDEFEKICVLKDNIFIYCEHKELKTIHKNHINELGEKYIYCYDFETKKTYKTHEKINYYLSDIEPIRENGGVHYIAHEYFPAGSWKKRYTLNE